MTLGFADAIGAPLTDDGGQPIGAQVSLALGQAAHLDLGANAAFRGTTALRRQFRPIVRIGAGPSPDEPCQRPKATLEIFDNLTGRTTVLYPTDPSIRQ